MSGFDKGGDALRALAENLNTIAAAVARPVEDWLGAAGEANAESLNKFATSLRVGLDDMMTAAQSCDDQVTADQKLANAPTPDEVEEARAAMEKVKIAAVSGTATAEQLMDAMNDYEKIRDEREQALAEHTDATTNCNLPGTQVCPPTDGGFRHLESPDEIGTIDPPGGGITQGVDDDTEGGTGAFTGEEGVPIEDTPGALGNAEGNAAPPASTSPASGDPTPSRASNLLSDTAAPASTELSTDGGATMTPQAGGLSTPSAQPYGTSPAAQPGAVTGAGNMLSSQPQQQPNRGGGNQQQRGGNRDDRTDARNGVEGIAALLGGGSPTGGVPAAATPASAMSSPGTAPSGAPASAPTAGAPAPAASGATPPASGANPNASPTAGPGGAMMGSGAAAQAKNQAMAPKPADTKPAISQELLDRAAELSKDGKPADDAGKKAS